MSFTPKQMDVLERQIGRGRDATTCLEVMGPNLIERIQIIVKEASHSFRNNQCDPMTALRYIAALSENFIHLEELQLRVDAGASAAEKLFARPATAA